MSGSSAGVADTTQTKTAYLTISLAQNVGTYTFGTVAGGDVDILGVEFYCSASAAGLTTITAQTDDTTVTTLLASLAVASITSGKPLTSAVTGPFILPSGKHLQLSIVGTNGTAGTLKILVRYIPCQSGAVIA